MTNYYRMSPSRNSSRRSVRQNFRNKRVGKERFRFKEENMLKYFIIVCSSIAVIVFIALIISKPSREIN